jgi:hypothetical protein
MMTKVKTQGLVSDLMPNIKLMQVIGHFRTPYEEIHGETLNANVNQEESFWMLNFLSRAARKFTQGFNFALTGHKSGQKHCS